MIRLCVCVVVLGGSIAFLSCNANNGSPDGGPHTDGRGPVKGGNSGVAGKAGDDPIGGFSGGTHSDGGYPIGGRGGAGGHSSGGTHSDGAGPIGGRGGAGGHSSGGTHSDGAGPIGGRGGSGGHGEIGGRGGAAGGTADAQPCDGLAFFQERALCASTYGVQMGKIGGMCTNLVAYVAVCGGTKVWFTQHGSVGDPLSCVYDSEGALVAARVCTDTPVPTWNCNHAPQSPSCLSTGTVPDTVNCTVASTCWTHSDGSGPIGGRSGL